MARNYLFFMDIIKCGDKDGLICFDLSIVSFHSQGFIHALSSVEQPSVLCNGGQRVDKSVPDSPANPHSFKRVGSGHIQQIAMVDHADIRGLVTT